MASSGNQEGRKIFLITFHITALAVTWGIIENGHLNLVFTTLLFVVLFVLTLIATLVYQLLIRKIAFRRLDLTLSARGLAFGFVLNLLPWLMTANFWEGIPATLLFAVVTALLSWFLDKWMV